MGGKEQARRKGDGRKKGVFGRGKERGMEKGERSRE